MCLFVSCPRCSGVATTAMATPSVPATTPGGFLSTTPTVTSVASNTNQVATTRMVSPGTQSASVSNDKFPLSTLLAIVAGVAVFCLLLGLLIGCCCHRKRRAERERALEQGCSSDMTLANRRVADIETSLGGGPTIVGSRKNVQKQIYEAEPESGEAGMDTHMEFM
eukprot:scpid105606/ scgid2022/ 